MRSLRIVDDAKTMLEIIQNPDRFCRACFKRIGVCEHTFKLEGR